MGNLQSQNKSKILPLILLQNSENILNTLGQIVSEYWTPNIPFLKELENVYEKRIISYKYLHSDDFRPFNLLEIHIDESEHIWIQELNNSEGNTRHMLEYFPLKSMDCQHTMSNKYMDIDD